MFSVFNTFNISIVLSLNFDICEFSLVRLPHIARGSKYFFVSVSNW
jgi:hypothetical protein